MRNLLLAYDGSEPAKAAAARAAELARLAGARVTVLVVGELMESGYGTVVPVVEAEVYEEVMADGVARAGAEGGDAEGRLEWGKPADQIVEVAEAAGADLIVLGHRGRGGLQSLFLGSVARHVLDHAPCSVLVVRATPA